MDFHWNKEVFDDVTLSYAKRVSWFSKSGGRVEFLMKEGGGAWWCGICDDAAANAQLAAAGGTTSVG
jgi:hypothetical protein